MYRPTVHYAYHPCDDAVLSVHEFAGRNWQLQERKRILKDEIIDGIDELGVLLAGHKKSAYWYGSQLSIEEARKLAPHNNATSLQVCVAVLAGMVWAMENPQAGMIEPDEMDFRRNLEVCMPYLGPVVGRLQRLDAAVRARRAVRGRPGSQRSVAVQERAGVSVRGPASISTTRISSISRHRAADAAARSHEPADAIIAGAREVLETANRAQLAGFVKERYSRLDTMLQMVGDPQWQLSAEDRQRALNALACFSSSTSAASPSGLLDHAIMIELVSRDLHHDLDAYRDFCRLRASRTTRNTPARRRRSRSLAAGAPHDAARAHAQATASATLDGAASGLRKLLTLFGL